MNYIRQNRPFLFSILSDFLKFPLEKRSTKRF
jgi:hypothetical protein